MLTLAYRMMRLRAGWRTLRVMSGTGLPGPGSDTREASEHKPSSVWVGYLIFALILLFLIVIDAQAVYDREWANVAGITLFTLAFMIVPTGGLKRLRRSVRARKPPVSLGSRDRVG
jgi:hypothetical protein